MNKTNKYNTFFHQTSEFSEAQFTKAQKEKQKIQQIYNKFNDDKFNDGELQNKNIEEYIVLDYNVDIESIGERSFSPDALKSYTRKYIPKLKIHTYNINSSSKITEDIQLPSEETKIIPAYINSQYIGKLMQDQFYHIARQCFLVNLIYKHFVIVENDLAERIKSIRQEIETQNPNKKILILLNDCKLELERPAQVIRQGLDSVIDETNHYLKQTIEKGVIVMGYNKNYIDESVLIDQIIEVDSFKMGKELKEHFKNDMLLLNNKTILDDKDKGYTKDWTPSIIFPPMLIDINKDRCTLKEFANVKQMMEKNAYSNNEQITLFSEPTLKKLFFYYRVTVDDIFYKIEFFLQHNLMNEQLYNDIILISHRLLNEAITQN